MTDRYASFANSSPGRAIVKRLGLPIPPRLRRYAPGAPPLPGPVHTGGSGRLRSTVTKLLDQLGLADEAIAGTDAGTPGPAATAPPRPGAGTGALIFDASGIADSAELRALYDFFHPALRTLLPSGRVLVLGTPPDLCSTVRAATAQRALEGFTRSLGRELRDGATATLLLVEPGGEAAIESTLRFMLSARSAYVSGQVIRVGRSRRTDPFDWDAPFDGKVALVTGAAGGIGVAIATVLARDGAHVVCLDVPTAGERLSTVADSIGGTAYQLDLTAVTSPERLAEHLEAQHGCIDIVVHNAGINRDRTLVRLAATDWDVVVDVNLSCQERVNDTLLTQRLIPAGGRIISVSSVSGIAGNRGQTNYATSKAGVIGMVTAMAPALAAREITINAVAPGFIETDMTARMPVVPREAGRRLNSLSQGGRPVDVAETVSWLAGPGSGGVTGNVVRVCGQSLLGA